MSNAADLEIKVCTEPSLFYHMQENIMVDTSFKTYTDITTTNILLLLYLETFLNLPSVKKI